MVKEQIHFGFLTPPDNPKDYFLGEGNLPRIVLEENGDWEQELPIEERQLRNLIDSINCTGFATTNQIEAYEHKAFGEINNYSDRFVSLMSGTTKYGNDPSRVYDAIREYGLIPEEMCPWSDDIESIDDYLSWKGVDKDACIAEGKKWKAKKDFMHNWVFNRDAPLDEKINNMKVAIRYSPLCLDVAAWQADNNGVYVRFGTSGHWTLCYRIDNLFRIFDSYPPSKKPLAKDFNFYYCKRISITKKIPIIVENQKAYSFMSEILKFLKELLTLDLKLIKTLPEPPVTNVSPITKPKIDVRRTLADIARDYIGRDASPNGKASNEVACAESVSNIIHEYDPSFPAGITYTPTLFSILDKSPLFRRTLTPSENCVIISPTEEPNIGHTGIFISNIRVVSNDSKTGLMVDNYSYQNWINYFKGRKNLHIYLFKPIT